MDVSAPIIAPRVVADLRPAADAAATAQVDRPPLAATSSVAVAPPSLSQEALVARTALAPGTADSVPLSSTPPERVLKPWGILMLPSDRPDARWTQDQESEAVDGRKVASSADITSPLDGYVTLDEAAPAGSGSSILAS